jgi:hypothetical protein
MTTLYDATSIETLDCWVVATFPPSIKRPNRTGPYPKIPSGTISFEFSKRCTIAITRTTMANIDAEGGSRWVQILYRDLKPDNGLSSCIAQILVSLIILLQYFSTIKTILASQTLDFRPMGSTIHHSYRRGSRARMLTYVTAKI